mmetsp:Transcript_8665/g.21142  ORF Transcript_8665/g.21142 Transcript_8665/m.21142 type:complete len:109 (+) Transcript_8665:216-542(+)
MLFANGGNQPTKLSNIPEVELHFNSNQRSVNLPKRLCRRMQWTALFTSNVIKSEPVAFPLVLQTFRFQRIPSSFEQLLFLFPGALFFPSKKKGHFLPSLPLLDRSEWQ